MFDRKVLKSRAKFVLARSFLLSIVACAIVSIIESGGLNYGIQNLQNVNMTGMSDLRVLSIYVVAGAMILAGIAVSIFIAAPLKVGLKCFMLRAADMEVKLDNLLRPIRRNYKNVLCVTFVRNLYVGLWSLVGVIPIVIGFWKFNLAETIYTLALDVKNGSFTASSSLLTLATIMILLTLIFMVPAMIKELQYSMVDYILAEDPDTPCRKAISKSKEMMVGNKWAYVKLVLSFFGWYIIASSVCCGAGLLLLAPYMQATYTQMYLEISGQGKDYSGFDYQAPFNGYENM